MKTLRGIFLYICFCSLANANNHLMNLTPEQTAILKSSDYGIELKRKYFILDNQYSERLKALNEPLENINSEINSYQKKHLISNDEFRKLISEREAFLRSYKQLSNEIKELESMDIDKSSREDVLKNKLKEKARLSRDLEIHNAKIFGFNSDFRARLEIPQELLFRQNLAKEEVNKATISDMALKKLELEMSEVVKEIFSLLRKEMGYNTNINENNSSGDGKGKVPARDF